ncbi:disease resistance protein [Striga asiatica]|uniref:Disease resistance protein n=1 Tax=Striga asiatica TaxID=4170 RepID=A0A5A7R006_STRAF|nr:disease resistance protein [Striga asiatica]
MMQPSQQTIIDFLSTILPDSSLSKRRSIISSQFSRLLLWADDPMEQSPPECCESSSSVSSNVPYLEGEKAWGTAKVTARRRAALYSSTCSLAKDSWRSILCFAGISNVSSFSCINYYGVIGGSITRENYMLKPPIYRHGCLHNGRKSSTSNKQKGDSEKFKFWKFV